MLADPSAAIALLWMRRSLQFLVHLLHELCEQGTSVAAAMRAAYDAHLEPYHGWVLKQARTRTCTRTCTCTCTQHIHMHIHIHICGRRCRWRERRAGDRWRRGMVG